MSVIARAAARLKALVTLGRVQSAQADAGADGRVVVQTIAGPDDLRVMQPYGLASRPLAGAEGVIVQVGSNADQAVVIVIDDRRYRVSLEGGEVALFDDLGSRVLLKRGGIIELEASTIRLGESATRGVARLNDSVTASASWNSWVAAVSTATGATPPVGAMGTITTASTKAVSE